MSRAPFKADPTSPTPIFLQIVDQVKLRVATGELKPGDSLMTVRELAEACAVNPNTIARAYRELEKDGVLTLIQGSGSFISFGSKPSARTVRRVEGLLQSPAVEARLAGLDGRQFAGLARKSFAQTQRLEKRKLAG
ncbi:GntR family transcriptional regulator [bacterium]|nr:GntR family transcriptional regulator [bacterium]